MKKIISLVLVGILVISVGSFALAADGGEKLPDWFKDMIKWRKDQVQQAVKDGEMTEKQAEYWSEHFDDMQKYHEENGIGYPGSCHDSGFGRGYGNENNSGFGPGMMNGGYWNNQAQ
ncbi:DUF2680 domain-containing protein [Brassicibacter mesophilus]|uniref:DUF2680 domain-containing protein n=1 Tax=Brassicibacter mesophilus TaxID=745119 RepID=UPI003D1E9E18